MMLESDERLIKFEEKEHHSGSGVQQLWEFKNGYTASVVKFPGSYGYNKNQWELAIFRGEELCYDTPITDDVLGYLDTPEVHNYLEKIAEL